MIASLTLPGAGTRIGNGTNLCVFLDRRKDRGKAGEFLYTDEEFSGGDGKINREDARGRGRYWKRQRCEPVGQG